MSHCARVVLVHGIFNDGSVFDPLTRAITARGHAVLAPSLLPPDGSVGLDELARQLKEHVDRAFGSQAPVTIVGYSMGGLVARYYLQHLGAAARASSLITLASPHHGSRLCHLRRGPAYTQMRPGSEFLQRLHDTQHRLEHMTLRSYYTPFDLMILPATSSIWPIAETIKVPVALHPLMVRDRRIRAEILGLLHD